MTPFIDNPEAVAAFPVPGTVVQLAFAWWSSDSGYTYNLTVTSDAPGVLPAPTFTPSGSSSTFTCLSPTPTCHVACVSHGITVCLVLAPSAFYLGAAPLSSGTIPQQRETLLLDFNCSGDEGKALIEANFTVSHAASGNVSVSSLYFFKVRVLLVARLLLSSLTVPWYVEQECAVDSSACGACGSCIKLGQCECATCKYRVPAAASCVCAAVYSQCSLPSPALLPAATTGSVCAVKPSTRVADTATAQWNTETVNVAVWNVFGAGSSGESPAQTAARFGEIGEYLRDSTANVRSPTLGALVVASAHPIAAFPPPATDCVLARGVSDGVSRDSRYQAS